MSVYKKINFALFFLAVTLSMVAYLYWNNKCFSVCNIEVIDTWLAPLIYGGRSLAFLFGFLLFFPGDVFKRWLQCIFSWGFPLSIWLIIGISINSSSILNPGTAGMAELLSWFFSVLTVIFIATHYLIVLWKHKSIKKI